ncbi:MAG: hypothetical protein HFE76_02280 [Firmicutes bacterium]|nr:hypothetical protein [Bacillota bacterium]
MFSNQRKNFFKSKWFYGIIALALLIFGIWVNYDGKSQNTNMETKVNQESQQQKQQAAPAGMDQETPEKTEEEPTEDRVKPSEEKQQSYYLIREIEGVVKVFYCDENGQETLHQITSIPFQLLSKEDQQMLTEGVQVDTESELAGFLENFDS